MGLESATFINDLNIANPAGSDDQKQGDDHLRLIKTALKQTLLGFTAPFQRPTTLALAADYTATIPDGPSQTSGDYFRQLGFDCTAAARTLTLPAAPIGGTILVVTKTDSSANTVTIQGNGKNINGAASFVLTASQFASVTLWFSGGYNAWFALTHPVINFTPANKAGDTFTGKVGITGGGNLPTDIATTLLQVKGADAAVNRMLMDSFAGANNLSARRANGTTASPSALTSGNLLFSLAGFGYGTTGYTASAKISIQFNTSENWTDTANGTQIDFFTTPNGTSALANPVSINNTGELQLKAAGFGIKFQDGTIQTTASASAFPAATQAEQETGSSLTVGVTPGRQQFHPSASKAWVRFNSAGTVAASYNITSITNNGTGDWTVNIGTDFSSANYCGVALIGGSGGLVANIGTLPGAGTFRVLSVSDPTPDLICATFFGDQA
jgi:hypothetical protein